MRRLVEVFNTVLNDSVPSGGVLPSDNNSQEAYISKNKNTKLKTSSKVFPFSFIVVKYNKCKTPIITIYSILA